jgi:uncharacterized protein YjaZ
MNINAIDSLSALKHALSTPAGEQLEHFRQQVMTPLRPLWQASMGRMGLGQEPSDWALTAAERFALYTPDLGASEGLAALAQLQLAAAWPSSLAALERAAASLQPANHGLKLDQVNFSLLLAHPTALGEDGFTGAANVSGWLLVVVWPNDFNLPRLNSIVVHEFHHLVRFLYEPFWPPTLGKYLVLEGLAEAFAASFYGEAMLGRWTTGLQPSAIAALKPRFQAALQEDDFNTVRGYIFGTSATLLDDKNHIPAFAGYALGYRLVLQYLERTGQDIITASYTSWQEIVAESGFFDN